MDNYAKALDAYREADRRRNVALEAIVAHLNEVIQLFPDRPCNGDEEYLEEFCLENGKVVFYTCSYDN